MSQTQTATEHNSQQDAARNAANERRLAQQKADAERKAAAAARKQEKADARAAREKAAQEKKDARANTPLPLCGCGCGLATTTHTAVFVPGHDATTKSAVLAANRAAEALALLARAQEQGTVRRLDDGTWVVLSADEVRANRAAR